MDAALTFAEFETFISSDTARSSEIDSDVSSFLKGLISLISQQFLLKYLEQKQEKYSTIKKKLEILYSDLTNLNVKETYREQGAKEIGKVLVKLMDRSLDIANEIEKITSLEIHSGKVQELRSQSKVLQGFGNIFIAFGNFKELKIPKPEAFNNRINFLSNPKEELIVGLTRCVKPLREGINLAATDLTSSMLVRIER